MENNKTTKEKKKTEKEIMEEEKRYIQNNAQNKNLNIIKKNPYTFGAIFLGLAADCLMLCFNYEIFDLIVLILIIWGSGSLYRARKIKENKKFIMVGYVIYLPIIFILIYYILIFFITILSFLMSS